MCSPLYIGIFFGTFAWNLKRHAGGAVCLEERGKGSIERLKAAGRAVDSYIRYKTFDRVGYCD